MRPKDVPFAQQTPLQQLQQLQQSLQAQLQAQTTPQPQQNPQLQPQQLQPQMQMQSQLALLAEGAAKELQRDMSLGTKRKAPEGLNLVALEAELVLHLVILY